MPSSRRAALLAAVFSLGLAASAHAETLAEAIALAYQSNPTLLNQRSTVRQADESYLRARRGFDPTVTANISTTLTGTENTNPAFGKNYTNTESSGVNVTANQTIYSGGRLSAAVKASEASLLAQRENLRQADETLIANVISAYNGVLQAQESLKIAEDNINVLQRQRSDAQARFDVGTQTRTDVAQAESRLAQAQATRINAQNTLDNARAQYRVTVGQSPGTLQAAPDLSSLLPMSLGQALDVAYENNPTIRGVYLSERASAANVAAARAVTRPQVSVGLTAGATPNIMSQRDNVGVTGSVTASIPLFTGFNTPSNIRSAQETNLQDQNRIEAQRRSLEQQVTNAWNALQAARASIRANTEAVTAADLTAQGYREQLNVGLSTTLDVLNAEQELRSAQLSLINARFTEYTASVNLLNAMGKLEVHTFAPNADLYDPEIHFRDINRALLPWEPLVNSLDKIGAPAIPERMPTAGEKPPTLPSL